MSCLTLIRISPLLLVWTGLYAASDIPSLVDIASIQRPLLEQIPYSTAANFTGKKLHPFPCGL